METINFKKSDISLQEFSEKMLSEKLLFTADAVEQYVKQGGKIHFMGTRSIEELCPALVTLLVLLGNEEFENSREKNSSCFASVDNENDWRYVSDISTAVGTDIEFENRKTLCVSDPDKIRLLAKRYFDKKN